MNLIIAGLASLVFSTDPEFISGAMTDYCEPYVRGEASLDQTRDRLVVAGFRVESDENYADPIQVVEYGQEPPPDFPARAVRLRRLDGLSVALVLDQEGPGCLATQPGSNSEALTRTIEASGRWLAVPGTRDDWLPPTEAEWLSPDGRLVLTSDLADDPQLDETYAYLRQASAPPERMLERREAFLSADRRTPGEALISALQDWCLQSDYDSVEGRDHHASRIAASGGTTSGGLRIDFRHRDPETTITLIYSNQCLLVAWGNGRHEAVAELRAWLNDPASGWDGGAQADTWTRPGAVVTLSPTDDGEAMIVNLRATDRMAE